MRKQLPDITLPNGHQSVGETLRDIMEYDRQCGPVKTYPARFRIRPVSGCHSTEASAKLNGTSLALTKAAIDMLGGPGPVYIEVDLIRKIVIIMRAHTYDRKETFRLSTHGEIHAPAMVRELKRHGFPEGKYRAEYDAKENGLVLKPQSK